MKCEKVGYYLFIGIKINRSAIFANQCCKQRFVFLFFLGGGVVFDSLFIYAASCLPFPRLVFTEIVNKFWIMMFVV